jgi:hypothetical protein
MYVRARTRHLSIYLSISSTATCLDAEVAALVIQRYERGRVARAAMKLKSERWRAQQRGSQAAAKLKREQDARQEDWLASTAHHPKR